MATRHPTAILGICATVGLTTAALAQPGDNAQNERVALGSNDSAPMSLAGWNYDRVYEGWSADGVVDRPIYGPHGDEIGSVKNLLLNTNGEIVALIAEVGGFLDLADTHVTIPWSEIERRDGMTYSPITEETAENYGMFASEYYTAADVGNVGAVQESFETGPRIWKATALLDDYVVMPDGEPFGYVTDMVFDDAGKLIAVVAAQTGAVLEERGVYAFPWNDDRWQPEHDHYTLRHSLQDIERLPTIDYSRIAWGPERV